MDKVFDKQFFSNLELGQFRPQDLLWISLLICDQTVYSSLICLESQGPDEEKEELGPALNLGLNLWIRLLTNHFLAAWSLVSFVAVDNKLLDL
jgi:hypothetical protein